MLYPDITYYEVAGNCDWGSTLPLTVTFELDGFKYMATHGHTYSVKFGLGQLCYAAQEAGVDCVFFGHTHYACDEVYEGIHLINPGSFVFESPWPSTRNSGSSESSRKSGA